MSIYTRTGDKGTTSLYEGKRISKASLRIEVCGTLDELNSLIGVTRTFVKDKKIDKELVLIQSDIFEIGSALSSNIKDKQAKLSTYLKKRVKSFEGLIDNLASNLPELRNFILPGGGESGSFLHLVRSIARRLERRLVALSEEESVDDQIMVYINRLSDLFFMMARFENNKQNKKETIWTK
jgi:cob(I)alamin adenosyltransferase